MTRMPVARRTSVTAHTATPNRAIAAADRRELETLLAGIAQAEAEVASELDALVSRDTLNVKGLY